MVDNYYYVDKCDDICYYVDKCVSFGIYFLGMCVLEYDFVKWKFRHVYFRRRFSNIGI